MTSARRLPRFRTVAACVLVGLATIGVGSTSSAADATSRPPNIVLIFTDDQGYADVGCFGATGFKTPHLDRMAAEGRKFTDFYSNCSVCSGSRAALMTGCHFQRVNMTPVLFPGSRVGLHPNEVTIAETLKSRGYATACIGKWHLGHLPPFLPTKQGFDEYLGIPYSNDMTIDPQAALAKDAKLNDGFTVERIRQEPPVRNVVPLMRGEEVIEYPVDQSTLTRRYTEEAIRFMRDHRDGPFFVYLPHAMCHVPLHASADFKGKSEAGLFGDVIEELDWSVGRILAAIKELGLDEHTLVVFTTDNGAASGSAKPLRGKKATMYEGGFRVPCLMRWPGRIPAGTVCGEVAATIDLHPTFAALAGAKLPADRTIDGLDVRPLLTGGPEAKSPHESYVMLHNTGAVRSGQWKYYPGPETGDKKAAGKKGKAAPAPPAPDAKPGDGQPVQLYDLSTDLSETKNVAKEHPEIVARLHKELEKLRDDIRQNARPVGRVEPN